jgi:DNA repair protein RadC
VGVYATLKLASQPTDRGESLGPKHDRPRERLVRLGPSALSEVELLAVLIGSGTHKVPVLGLSRKLLEQFGSVAGVARATIEELESVPGIKRAKATKIVAAFELARRGDDTPCAKERADMSDPKDVAGLARSYVKDWRKECFFTVHLDSRNRFVGKAEVSVGSLDTTLAHPREVFERAIRAGAASVIVVHNHPSGDPTPSDDDIRLTRRLTEAGKILGIRLLDHVVVSRDSHYSFRSHALV